MNSQQRSSGLTAKGVSGIILQPIKQPHWLAGLSCDRLFWKCISANMFARDLLNLCKLLDSFLEILLILFIPLEFAPIL